MFMQGKATVTSDRFNSVAGPFSHMETPAGKAYLNPLVRKLSFTGSTPVGRLLMSQCAESIKKVSLLLPPGPRPI